MLQLINIKTWAAAESLITQSNETAADIANPEVSQSIEDVTQSQLDSLDTNVEFLGFMNQYAWIFIGIIIFVIIYLAIREQKEIQSVYG